MRHSAIPRCIHTQNLNSYIKECKRTALDTIILKTRSEFKVKVTVTQKWYVTFRHPKMHLHTKFGIPISKNTGDMHQTQYSFQKLGQSSSLRSQWPNNGKHTLSLKDASTHQIWDSYLKYFKRYAPDTIILKTRSEVTVKVIVTQKWYATLRHLKMYLHTKFGIPNSNNIGDMPWTESWKDGRTDGRTVRLLYASQSSFGRIKMPI